MTSPPGFLFCGMCGTSLFGVKAPAAKIPKRTLIVGAILLVVGLTAAVASFSTIQAQGSVSSARSFGGPVVNWLLGLAGIDGIEAPEGGDGASGAIIAGFVLGCMMTALGACLVVIGGAVAIVRLRPRAKAAAAWDRAQPTVDQAKARTQDAVEAAKPVVAGAARTSRAKLVSATQKGSETWQTEAVPRLADAAKRGRRGWATAKPKAAAAAAAGSRRLKGLVGRRSGGRDDQDPAELPALGPGSTGPGWYDDPGDRGQLRYWDGSQWTESVAHRGTPGPT